MILLDGLEIMMCAGYPRVVVDATKGELPALKVALQAVCTRPDGTIGVSPAELARVLTERGGYGEKDLIFLLTTSGEKLRVSIENLRQIAPEKAQMFMFGWKRTLADIKAEGEAKAKERAEAAAGEKALLFSVHVADPAHWRSLLGPWLSRMRGFGPLSDTKIQLIVRNEKEENPANRKSRCHVSTFDELMEYINDMEKLLKICPGLLRAMTNRQPFVFELGIRAPPPSGFRLWNRAHGDPERNRRYLERLAVAFTNVHDDSRVEWKFAKHKGQMTPDHIRQIRILLQSAKPRDAALVREILAILGVPADDIARLTGRLNIKIIHEPTDQDKVLLREGVVTMDIARANGARISRNISAHGNPKAPVNIELPSGEYSLSYSLYSPTQQVSGSPCSIRTAEDFKGVTWETALQWCNLKFQDLRSLAAPFLWIEGVQTAMYPPSQPGTPVVSFQNDIPLGFTFRRPGSPLSDILPSDIYFNLVQQPGTNVPGATFVQRVPTPSGNIKTDINYFGADPDRWRRRIDPGTAMAPRGTTGEFNVYPDPDQEEAGKAFANPLHQTVEIPGFSRMPDLHESFNLVFNLSKPPPPTGELVYVQAPAGNGRYFYCPGITIQQFLSLKNKEEAARLCGIPIDLLDGDVLVSTFTPGTTPNYAPARPAVPVILVDRLQRPHYYTALWDEHPMKYIGPILEEGHPEDQMVFTFANSDQCVLNRQMLHGLASWVELARFCSVTFEGVRPTQIVGTVQPVYFLPPVQIVMPESLKTTFMKTHNGVDPQDIFSKEPVAYVINNLLASQNPGVTLETTLEMADGSKFNFSQIPNEWKHLPAPQIPGLARITIKDINAGTLGDLLAQLNIGGSTPFSQFVSKITGDVHSPTGMKIPSSNIRIGGPTPPGAPTPRFELEMFNPETLGSDGYPTNFGTRVPVAHGAIPETMPMENVIKMLHNPYIAVHQKAKPEYKITAITGNAVPFTTKAEHLDAPLSEVVRWFTSTLGIEDNSSILITVVVDGVAYRAPLSAAQLLGHTIGSVLGLAGAVDLDDSHDVVFIGQPAPGITAKKISPSQQMNFVVNGAVYDKSPGSPLDFAKLLNIQVPGKGQAPTDYKFSISGPGGETIQQLVPADFIHLLQEIAEMHGNPGLSLVLSFLNSLKQAAGSLPFKHPNAAINALLNTPAGSVPEGSYLVVFTGTGPTARKVTVPITALDRDKTIQRLLEHLNIALNSIADAAGQIPVEDGSVDLGILGQSVKVPLRFISSTDKNSIDDLLKRMGQRLGSMLQEARIPNQPIVLRTVFTKRDGTSFTVETPLGTTENAQKMLSSLTLWALVPEEAQHQHIKHVSMSVQVVGTPPSAQGIGFSSVSQSSAGVMLPTEQTWGTLPGQPASTVPGFFIQEPGEKRSNLADVGEQLVRVFFRKRVSSTGVWSRVFWGIQTPGGCSPKTEFPYYLVMGTKLADVPVPVGKNCMVIIQLDQKFKEAVPSIRPQDFEVEFLYHEPPLQAATAKGRKLLHSHSMEADAVKKPIRDLIEKAIGWGAVSSAQSCLITNPQVPFPCDDPLPLDPDRDTLERLISSSRYVLVTMKQAPAEQAAAFLQRSPFLARISRVQNLR
ncbi:uncharacterized protein EMH_0044390 [Eimeria mitis]|uniref:Uncharacterized protein n=1 Tax=Eimeria mitis TaxID=44415 RepID=U6KD32_9EIME|nr:uncharacterized protein EMH_0044390 [Eimeria mitis]CDJ35920.1 hypothetical protein, conserved [Eimeria mitis]